MMSETFWTSAFSRSYSKSVTLLELGMHDELNNLLRALEPIFEKYGVLKVMVFGSFARGEPSRRSDLDLLIIRILTRGSWIVMTVFWATLLNLFPDVTWTC